MAFLIRFITKSASGRDIVRPRRVTGDTVLIGRDPSNAIHLPDLSVRTQHASITRSGARQVTIEALTDLPVLVDDRPTKKRQVAIASGAEVRIGSHRLEIGAGETADDVAIDVVKIDDAAVDKDEAAKRFSLARVAPGKRAMAYGLMAILLALFLAWPILSYYHSGGARLTPEQMASGGHGQLSWNSGPLSAAHASLARNCRACHVDAFVAVPDKACATCHTNVHGHADPARLARAAGQATGFRAIKMSIAHAFGRPGGRCVDCHLEHQGPQSIANTEQRFCTDCHGKLQSNLPDTKLGDASDFGSDHPELRPLVMTTPGHTPKFTRISMADAPHEDSGLKFPHDLHLSVTGGVARMAQTMGKGPLQCADCHVPDDSGTRFRPVSMERNCQQCHSLAFDRVGGTVRTLRHGDVPQIIADLREHAAAHPTTSSFVAGMRRRPGVAGAAAYRPARTDADSAIRAIFSPGGACYDCHTITRPAGSNGLDYHVMPVKQTLRYLHHGWFDHGAHRSTSCATCHDAKGSNDASDVLLPSLRTCQQCHGGEKASTPLVPSTCVMCHDYHKSQGAPQSRRTVSVPGAPRASLPLQVRKD